MFQFATNVSKTIFGELLYICSSTVEKNLRDTAFHTLIFLFQVNAAIKESPLPLGKKTTWPHKSGNFKMLTNYQQS